MDRTPEEQDYRDRWNRWPMWVIVIVLGAAMFSSIWWVWGGALVVAVAVFLLATSDMPDAKIERRDRD